MTNPLPARTMSDMQEYQVTARKWRPSEFASVVGQEHVTQTLRNAIRQGRLHHAYLFSGPRGVGKTTTARILAKALNCTNPGEDLEPCNACDSCREITEGRSMDVVEIDGASNNSVDDVRKLRDNAKYPPVGGRYKLYIIDEVHMLSTSAFNALLKTLEEPPRHLVFVFATTEPHKVPATILSRCQRFDFRRMQITDIVGRLKYIAEREGIEIEEDALVVIAKKGDGSMRDAQSIFDQVRSFCGPSVTYAQANEALNIIDQGFFFRVTDMMRAHDVAEAFVIVDEMMRVGYDVQEFLIGLAEHLRNYLTVIATGSARLVETARAYLDRYEDEARRTDQGDLVRALHVTLGAQQAIRFSSQPRLRLELALVQLAVMDSTVNLVQLLERIDRLSDAPASAAPPAASASATSAPAMPPASTPPAPAPVQNGQAAAAGGANSTEGTVPTEGTASPADEAPAADEPGLQHPAAGSTRPEPREERRTTIENLASFPTAAPVTTTRAPMFTADVPPIPPRGSSGNSPNASAGGSYAAVAEAPRSSLLDASVPGLRDVQRRWGEFLQYCGDKKFLATMLQATQPTEIFGTTLRVFVPTDVEMNLLNRNREVLVEKLQGFFKAPFTIEGAIGTPAHPSPSQPVVADRGGIQSHLGHPWVKGMIALLEADPVG